MEIIYTKGVYERLDQLFTAEYINKLHKYLPESSQSLAVQLTADETKDFLEGLQDKLQSGEVSAFYSAAPTVYHYKGIEVRLAPNHQLLQG